MTDPSVPRRRPGRPRTKGTFPPLSAEGGESVLLAVRVTEAEARDIEALAALCEAQALKRSDVLRAALRIGLRALLASADPAALITAENAKGQPVPVYPPSDLIV